MDIIEYYKGLGGYKQKAAFREKVMIKCGMSYPCFQSRIQRNNWTKLEKEAIGQLIEKEKKEAAE